jgi:hypothetical protein
LISSEATKAKDRFRRLGFLIRLISQNPTKLSSLKVSLQRATLILLLGGSQKKLQVLNTLKYN